MTIWSVAGLVEEPVANFCFELDENREGQRCVSWILALFTADSSCVDLAHMMSPSSTGFRESASDIQTASDVWS
ncbi:hypothetical protein RN04_14730 [Arthrobacter sp. W1]|nr:hypothetical protein RN04_14730 [Arthrobacter sp. W1]